MNSLPVNTFKQALIANRRQVGLWVTLAHQQVAEAAATCGFDWLLFDMEHSPTDLYDVGQQLLAARLVVAVGQVGQDHHVGVFLQRVDRPDCPGDRRLPVHLVIEEQPEQSPDFFGRDRLAGLLVADYGNIVVSPQATCDDCDALREWPYMLSLESFSVTAVPH